MEVKKLITHFEAGLEHFFVFVRASVEEIKR